MITDTKQAITYQEETITIKMRKVEETSKDHYEFVQQERLVQVAYIDGSPTGLAYYTCLDGDGETVYSLTHVPTGCSVLGNEYDMGCAQALKHWIELCLEFADWTGPVPQIISTRKVLKYATIGAREEA